MITLNVSRKGENWKSWLRTTLASSPFFTFTTIRTGCLRSLSSTMSVTPVIRPALTSSASFLRSGSLVSWYGISVKMIWARPSLCSSTVYLARRMTRPRPVRYASRIPQRPQMVPPVGKSGPGMTSSRSSRSISGLLI